MDDKRYERKFLAISDDISNTDTLNNVYEQLAKMPIDSLESASLWISAYAEINLVFKDIQSKANINAAKDTQDEEIDKELTRILTDVTPVWKRLNTTAKKRFLSIPDEWIPKQLSIARQLDEWDVEIYRDENVDLLSQDSLMGNEYQKISSAWQTEFDGKMQTPQQLSVYSENIDRDVRERAHRARVSMSLNDYEKLNDLFDRMFSTREQIAKNANQPDFAHYQYKNYGRLSYNLEDTRKFYQSVVEYVVPAYTKILENRKKRLGVDKLRPWDLSVDIDGLEPGKAFETIDELVSKSAEIFGKVDPEFKKLFLLMDQKGLLDLDNRVGKAPGAFMDMFGEERLPTIFANAVGSQNDLRTIFHEAGHAVHGYLSRDLLFPAQSVPMEFAEVASMGMELLVWRYLDIIIDNADELAFYKRQKLERTLYIIAYIAMHDEMQVWIYTSGKGGDRAARGEQWLKLLKKYQPAIDHSGIEDISITGWQILHTFVVPLYMIEYAVAQIGALQVYKRCREDYTAAVDDYKTALSLGGTKGLPELFDATGVKFVMKHPEVLRQVVDVAVDILEE